MKLGRRRTHNIPDLESANGERIRHQRTVASPRNCFSAHQHTRLYFREFDGAFQTRFKLRRLHVIGESSEAGVVPAQILGFRIGVAQAAEFFQMRIRNAELLQRRAERFAIELRIVPGAGNRANIHYTFDAIRSQQVSEFVERPRGMPDGEDESFLFVFSRLHTPLFDHYKAGPPPIQKCPLVKGRIRG